MPTPSAQGKVLGILKPLGGGDPIPLVKNELVIGRRRSCDICLDFHNVSGKHCQLRFANAVWHVRDLGSTNGTSLNGLQLTTEHNVLPDDELGIASHYFKIDYEPGGPDALHQKHDAGEHAAEEPAHRLSLLELAGIESDDKPRPRSRPRPSSTPTPTPSPSRVRKPTPDESGFDDAIPDEFQPAPPPLVNTDDDDFLKFIEEDVKKAGDKREDRR